MSEPLSTGGGGLALYKLALALGIPAVLVSVVVMSWTQPKSKREWASALICTVVSSVGGGAGLVEYFGLQHLATGGMIGLVALGGVIFACGLPGWVIVRAGFAWADKRKDKDLGELYQDIKKDMLP